MAHSKGGVGENTSVSIVVLAFNESLGLITTVESIHQALDDKFPEYEIIIVNDGSEDDTGQIAEEITNTDSRVKVVHNQQNMGCGFTFMRGVEEASYNYVWLIPGDGEITRDSIKTIADHIGTADMVIPYVLNSGIRPLSRRIISLGYTTILNILFWKRLHYYNGPCVIKTQPAKKAPRINSRGFAFMAPILLKLIKQNYSYIEVGIELQPRRYGRPSVNSLLNIFSALKTMTWFFWSVNFGERSE